MSRRIETVAVVGRDAALWLAALALHSAFARTGVKVLAVELPSYLPEVEAYASLPTLAAMHDLLGLNEDRVIGACSGVYTLGQRFAHWSGGRPFMHPYDTLGGPIDGVDFVQYWLSARARGAEVPIEEFSLGAVAAKQARVVAQNAETETLSNAAHGYHLDARAYTSLLRSHAVRAGVEALRGPVQDVKKDGDRILALGLPGEQMAEADLFVDVSIEGALFEDVLGVEFESWDRWFAADRILHASGKRLNPLPSFSQIFAVEAGWIGMYPLQNRTAVTAVYNSRLISDRDMLKGIAAAGVGLEGEPAIRQLVPGARKTLWVGNCVAIGEAAARLEPLDSAPLQFVQVGVTQLVALFPADADNQPEAEIYDAAIRSHLANIRDFQLAHYKLNGRVGQPYWDRARAMQVPQSLAYKIDLFRSRGLVAWYDDETFAEANWTSILLGHGITPRSYDPLVDRLSEAEQNAKLQELLGFIRHHVSQMPSVEAQLEIITPGPGLGLF